MAHTSTLHVRVDDELKADAAEKLASFGLTLSDLISTNVQPQRNRIDGDV